MSDQPYTHDTRPHKYDSIELPKEPEKPTKPEKPEPPKCAHQWETTPLINEYSDDLCDQVIQHGRDGNIIYSFCGRYNISTDAFISWLAEEDNQKYKKFRDSVKTSMSAAICYYNKEIIHAIKNYGTLGDSIPVLRAMLSDLMKSVPKMLDQLLFEGMEPPKVPKTPEQIAADKAKEAADEAAEQAQQKIKLLNGAFKGIDKP